MSGLDHAIAQLAGGHALLVALAVALLLGLRHATDPDHLAAVSTLRLLGRAGELEHRHLHAHGDRARHGHRHDSHARLGRSPLQAYGIGLVHGTGGSAGVGVLLLAGIPSRGAAAAALLVFALAAATSMATLSSGFRCALTRGPTTRARCA